MIRLSIAAFLACLVSCGATPESIAEEACRCEKMAGSDDSEISKCRDIAKSSGEQFKTDPEAMDRGIKAYNDCLNTPN